MNRTKEVFESMYAEFYQALPPVYNQEEDRSYIINNSGEEVLKRLSNI